MSRNNPSLAALAALLTGESQGQRRKHDETVTLESELARGLGEINAQNAAREEGRPNPFTAAGVQFARDLIQFTYERAKALGLSGVQFGDTFGAQAGLQQEFQDFLDINAEKAKEVQP